MSIYNQVKAIEKRLRLNEKNRIGKVKLWNSEVEFLKAKENGEINKDVVNIIDNIPIG